MTKCTANAPVRAAVTPRSASCESSRAGARQPIRAMTTKLTRHTAGVWTPRSVPQAHQGREQEREINPGDGAPTSRVPAHPRSRWTTPHHSPTRVKQDAEKSA
jgi:hypothetical protein